MRENSQTRIIGNGIILVPYRRIHVPQYHKWMQSPKLQELTASEPLTEEEEYEMQQSWLNDENKCTFIVLDRKRFEENTNEVGAMIGDTNLYLIEIDGILTGETGIMVAEESVRGQGRGKEAMLLMLRYGVDDLKIQKFIAKISFSNETSIKMFKKLGFEVEETDTLQSPPGQTLPQDQYRERLADMTDTPEYIKSRETFLERKVKAVFLKRSHFM